MGGITIRRATSADGDTLLRLIRGLADYEKLTPPDDAAAQRVTRDLAAGERFEAIFAEKDGRAVGYALYFETYSTFRGLPKLYMEDLYVAPDERKTGAGFALFRAVVEEAMRLGCCVVEWNVLDWNELAIEFYERVGGRHEKEWPQYELGRKGMERLLGESA
jgi:GNAT superfamily N-acetyltransferase